MEEDVTCHIDQQHSRPSLLKNVLKDVLFTRISRSISYLRGGLVISTLVVIPITFFLLVLLTISATSVAPLRSSSSSDSLWPVGGVKSVPWPLSYFRQSSHRDGGDKRHLASDNGAGRRKLLEAAKEVVRLRSLGEMKLETRKPRRRPDVVDIKVNGERPRVLLVTAIQETCNTWKGDDAVLRALKNKLDYARLHGMSFSHSVDLFVEPREEEDPSLGGAAYSPKTKWQKIATLKEKMTLFPDYDWYFWLDYNAVITDMAFEIPWKNYANHSLVLWGSAGVIYSDKPSLVSIGTSTVYVRNNDVAKKLLDRLIDLWSVSDVAAQEAEIKRVVEGTAMPLTEQASLVYVLSKERERWQEHVFLENNYHITRYWRDENDRLEEYYGDWRGEGQFPPFVVSYADCRICSGHSEAVEQCIRQFQRGLRFANNQVLSVFGFTHENLTSNKIIPVPTAA